MLQASEGGSFSVGNRKFKIKASVTPPPAIVTASPAEGTPVAMPATVVPKRVSRTRRFSPPRLSTLAPATDKMVVSKSALVGFCLTAFAGGVVMTLAVDRVHARATEPAREPIVLQTTSIPAPTDQATAHPATAPAPQAAAPDPVAAADAVVVQLPKPSEKPAPLAQPAPRAPRPVPAPTAVRAAAVHAGVSHKKNPAPEESPTEAAPDEPEADSALPAPVKKKWVDPFDP